MPDITMCDNATCWLRAGCRRHQDSGTKPSEPRQEVSTYAPIDALVGFQTVSFCEHFWPVTVIAGGARQTAFGNNIPPLEMTLRPTSKVERVNGTPSRKWTGTTTTGTAVVAWIAMVQPQTAKPAELATFEKELMSIPQVERSLVSFDYRMVL